MVFKSSDFRSSELYLRSIQLLLRSSPSFWFSSVLSRPERPPRWFGWTGTELHTHHDSAGPLSAVSLHFIIRIIGVISAVSGAEAVLRSVEKPPDHSQRSGQTAICDLSKHDGEQRKF